MAKRYARGRVTMPLAADLPTWSAILIALGGSAVGGVAGSALTTWRQIQHQREEQMRTLMLSAADDFATGIVQAHIGLRALLMPPPDTAFAENYAEHEPEAARRVDEAQARIARVMLLFGRESPAGTAAREAGQSVLNAMWNMKQAAPADRQAVSAGAKLLNLQALRQLGSFTRAAREATKKPLDMPRRADGGQDEEDQAQPRRPND